MKSKRGAITLYVTVVCLFVLIIGIIAYVGTSGRQANQLAALNKIEGQYNNNETTAEDLYQQYNGGDIIPIYTPEQFAKVGSGEEVYIEQTGKFYVFGTDKTYMFYGVPEDLNYYIEQLTDEIKEQIKVEIGAESGSIEAGGILKLAKSTNALTTSLTITATATTEDGIQTYVPPTGEEKLYASGTTEISETYEITKNGIYTFSVVDQKGNVTDAEIQITNIVVDGIGMVLNTTDWTKDDVILTVTWPTASEKGRKEIKIGDGAWTRYTGASTVLTISENATIQARVTDGTENAETKKNNEVIVGNIDKAQPILTATTGTLTITEGDSYDVASLFEYDQNGIAPIEVEYTESGYEIANINELEPSETEYEITCTVTKANGYQLNAVKKVKVNYLAGGDATEIASEPRRYYGRTVSNYECDGEGLSELQWQIFNSDGEYIYLISYLYSDNDYFPTGRNGALIYIDNGDEVFFNNIIGDYEGCINILDETITDSRVQKWVPWEVNHPDNTTDAAKAIAYMLDCNVWSVVKDSRFAEYAIGGPTVQMIVDVCNQKRAGGYGQELTIELDDTYGYEVVGDSDSYYSGSYSDPLIFTYDRRYWVTGFMGADYMGYFRGNMYNYLGQLKTGNVVARYRYV